MSHQRILQKFYLFLRELLVIKKLVLFQELSFSPPWVVIVDLIVWNSTSRILLQKFQKWIKTQSCPNYMTKFPSGVENQRKNLKFNLTNNTMVAQASKKYSAFSTFSFYLFWVLYKLCKKKTYNSIMKSRKPIYVFFFAQCIIGDEIRS